MMESNLNEDKQVNTSNKNHHAWEPTQQLSNTSAGADTVLLSDTNKEPDPAAYAEMVLEDILEPLTQKSGPFRWWGGRWQLYPFLAAITALATDGMNLYYFVFLNAPVDYHCVPPLSDDSDKFNGSLSKCTLDSQFIPNTTENSPCTKWIYDKSEYSTTLTTEFNLVCSQSWLSPAFQLCYIFGTMAGDIIGGNISDRFGRRMALRVGFVVSFSCVFVIGFSPWLPLILFGRLVQGIAYTVMFCPCITLMTEIILPEARSIPGMLLDVFYAIAIIMQSGLAYLIRDWRVLHFSTSFFFIALMPLALYYVDESIRWLIQHDRLEDAQKVLERAARCNDKLDEYKKREAQYQIMFKEIQKTSKLNTESSKESFGTWLKSGMEELYDHPEMRKISFCAPLLMFLMGVLYNGIPFNANNFEGSSYWYMFGMGVMELGSVVSGVYVIKHCSRVFMFQWTIGLSAICILLTTFVPNSISYMSWVLVMMAMWSAAMTYNLEFMWIDEIYPTSVRQRGGSMCHFVGHLGAFAASFTTEVLASFAWWLPNTLMSSCGIASIALASMLPETIYVNYLCYPIGILCMVASKYSDEQLWDCFHRIGLHAARNQKFGYVQHSG